MKSFSKWLQMELNKRNWLQSDLARASHLNRAVVSKLLRDKCDAQLKTLEAISLALDIPVAVIYYQAGVLPHNSENHDPFLEEAIDIFRKINNPSRRQFALRILRMLAEEDANDN